jgi:hypothetical protein
MERPFRLNNVDVMIQRCREACARNKGILPETWERWCLSAHRNLQECLRDVSCDFRQAPEYRVWVRETLKVIVELEALVTGEPVKSWHTLKALAA